LPEIQLQESKPASHMLLLCCFQDIPIKDKCGLISKKMSSTCLENYSC